MYSSVFFMCPDECSADCGWSLRSPWSLASLALWSSWEAISFFCLLKLCGSLFRVPASACRRSWILDLPCLLSSRLAVELFLCRRGLLLFAFICVDLLNTDFVLGPCDPEDYFYCVFQELCFGYFDLVIFICKLFAEIKI
ncbi:hypothetical protein NPIL_580711 [Nephila pilipes]|uniref:Uncharacterized protein n=1 Tax=Nephila pilipes TaxID=299642 RepID=A0A8X6UAZ2_NEPPI|nr:hypothetical protein NPIL_580711 [Nephila pilipes]